MIISSIPATSVISPFHTEISIEDGVCVLISLGLTYLGYRLYSDWKNRNALKKEHKQDNISQNYY